MRITVSTKVLWAVLSNIAKRRIQAVYLHTKNRAKQYLYVKNKTSIAFVVIAKINS